MPAPGLPRGGRGARLTPEAKARILELLADGGTVEAAAADVGWSARSITREAHRDRGFWDSLTDAMATGAAVRQRRRRDARIAS